MVTRSVRTNERTNAADGQPENIMPSSTLSGGEGIINTKRVAVYQRTHCNIGSNRSCDRINSRYSCERCWAWLHLGTDVREQRDESAGVRCDNKLVQAQLHCM